MSSPVGYLEIRDPVLIDMLINSAEGMYELEIDNVRTALDDKSVSVILRDDVKESFQRVAAIQEVMQFLKHATSIPPASHKHPTVIPLTSHDQVAVVNTIIEFAYDVENDTLMEPLWGLRSCLPELTPELVDELRDDMNVRVDRLVAITELKAVWKESLR